MYTSFQEEIRSHLEQLIETSMLFPQQRTLLYRVLQEPGNIFSPHVEAVPIQGHSSEKSPHEGQRPCGIWSSLAYSIAQQVAFRHFDCARVSTIAVAVECFMCALDLLDDLEDDDKTPLLQAIGIPQAVTATSLLLGCSTRTLLSFQEQGMECNAVLHLFKTLTDTLLLATAGQHRDLLAESVASKTFTTEECLSVIHMKSASLVRMICHLGALSVQAPDSLCQTAATFGEYLGTAQQIDNDCNDLFTLLHSPKGGFQKSDLIRHKKTLPILLASQQGSDPFAFFEEGRDKDHLIKVLDGAIKIAWQLGQYYHRRAYECLSNLSVYRPIEPALLRLIQVT